MDEQLKLIEEILEKLSYDRYQVKPSDTMVTYIERLTDFLKNKARLMMEKRINKY